MSHSEINPVASQQNIIVIYIDSFGVKIINSIIFRCLSGFYYDNLVAVSSVFHWHFLPF